MKVVTIPGTELTCSRFIFGTGSLFKSGSKSKRLSLLAAAVDNGFTHFDTAPYYGFGMAERDLSTVLKKHPEVTVTTKAGLYSNGGEEQPEWEIVIRKAAGRVFRKLSRPIIDYSVRRAAVSLDDSLRRLGRDRVEMLMLHEPDISLVRTDEWQIWLEKQVMAGKVRYYGLSLTADQLQPFLDHAIGLTQVIQLQDSLNNREADILCTYSKPMQITYAYVSAAKQAGSPASVSEILTGALKRNSTGSIVVSTGRIDRLSQYSRILEGIQ